MSVQTPSDNNYGLTEAALLNGGRKLPIKFIDTNGATNGQVLAYNASSGQVEYSAVTASALSITGQAAGDILYFNGTAWVKLAIGTAGQVLTVNAGATAPEWQTP